ncbi:MAG: hydrogenase formation protein HypD [Candidatus Thermoplasmatota archaeon]|nr:hydrogenase formation protein HypD [Candidatus Thermoplasmatota archaeon]MBS3790773.1 hydrogenase formation protein HypD [Candidatus Thermoplasmatota archaeon]
MKPDLDQFKFRDEKKAQKIVKEIDRSELDIKLMHVCGTHQDTLVKHGLEPMLEKVGVEIIQGPGCPVCVTTQREIEEMIRLAEDGKTIAVFGDMINVPGVDKTLSEIRSEGADVEIVYSVDDAVKLAEDREEEIVFISVGFETTVPSTANVIVEEPPQNFSILSCNRVIPPALEAILEMGEVDLDGLIEPGHVSTIIGTKPYEPLSEEYSIPQVVAGFEPLDLLMAVLMLLRQVERGKSEVENEYGRVVKEEGNKKALEMIDEVFDPKDVEWRGFPEIPKSGLELRKKYQYYSARKRFSDSLEELKDREFEEPEGCLCGEVLRGVIDSKECDLFGEECTPSNPVGPCMVSREGACNIEYRYTSG